MTRISTMLLVAFLLPIGVALAASSSVELAPGVDLLPGRFVPNTQPDGNSVIFRGPAGLVVVDTGRHADHTQGIVDFAARLHVPVKVIVNTHWHLDHIGGNPRLRREFPGVRVYASSALSGALKGFLASYRSSLVEEIKQAATPEKAQSLRAEVAIIDAGPALAPDEVVSSSGERVLAGVRLDLELESHAVTAGDVWVFDPKTRVLAAGDLVTLPVPFFDTACPEHWRASLDRLAKTDFKLLVPGHGPPMQRQDFETYRQAFGNLLSCAASIQGKQECIAGWLHDAGSLLANEDPRFTRALLDTYIDDSLRGDPAKAAKLCGAAVEVPVHHSPEFWRGIRAHDFALPAGELAIELIRELTSYLAAPDPELRDDFAYGIPAVWIYRDQRLGDAELRELLATWQANLKIKIRETGTDSVLRRSFSALDLSLLAALDLKRQFLSQAEFEGLLSSALGYLANEADVRGFDPRVGWIHATAHTADLLKFLCRNAKLRGEDQVRVLDAVAGKLGAVREPFTHSEPERLAHAVLSLALRQDLRVPAFDAFIAALRDREAALWRQSSLPDPASYAAAQNGRELLKSLSVLLDLQPSLSPAAKLLRDKVLAALH